MYRSKLVVRRVLLLAPLALAPLSACGNDSAGDTSSTSTLGTAGTEEGEEGATPAGAQASDLAIAKVSINQGVQVTLHLNGSDVSDRNADLVAGRRALVRVFVAPLAGFADREVQAVLTLEGAQGSTSYESTITVSGVSTDADLGSTFAFDIPGEDIPGDQAMSVTLYEVGETDYGGDTSSSAWPADGSTYAAPFQAIGPLRITLVPIQYDADGSGRLPDVSEAQIQLYQDLLEGMYPVPGVEVTVAAPFPWGATVANNGQGWQQLLTAMIGLRSNLGLGSDEYIYGLFNPAGSLAQYCGAGCVAGLSLLAQNPGDAMARASIGMGFTGNDSALTLAHEVGHAHGREHAPCMLFGQPSDPGYPYPDAVLGVWGWDAPNNALKSPEAFTDIMGYCKPNWISDYSYQGLLGRSLAVNLPGMGDEPPPREWSTIGVDDEGQATTSRTVQTLALPERGGELHPLRFLDAAGTELGRDQAHFYPTDHLPGGLLVWPRAPEQARSVEVEGFGRVTL